MNIFTALMGFFVLSSASMAVSAPAEAPAVPPVPSYEVAMTAYNAVPEQTDSNPFETASGAYSNPEVVAARSQDLRDELPFGTIIEIDGPTSKQNTCGYHVVSPILGYRVIADTMNVRYTNRVDVLFSTDANYTMADLTTQNASTIFGLCRGVTIRVVGHLDPARMGKLPKTQAELVAIVTGKSATNGSLALK